MFSINIENLKTLNYHIFKKKKRLGHSIVYSKCGHEYEKDISRRIN